MTQGHAIALCPSLYDTTGITPLEWTQHCVSYGGLQTLRRSVAVMALLQQRSAQVDIVDVELVIH